jgi:hypothetical protein
MAKTVKIKRSTTTTDVPTDRIEGCILVPLSDRKDNYPLVDSRVLPNTYYRVVKDEDRVRALVTVMPDGTKVAWDSCARCYGWLHNCRCNDGLYHSRSIAWIRATCDVKYPTEKVTDYSQYYDPWARRTNNPIDATNAAIGRSPAADIKPSTTKRKTVAPVAEAPVDGGISVSDIENIDLDAAARKQAKRTVRRARNAIKGGK